MEVCPAGFFCFDKTTVILLVITIIIIVAYNIGANNNKINELSDKINNYSNKLLTKIGKLKNERKVMSDEEHIRDHIVSNNLAQKELNQERVYNPLYPPLKTNTYFRHNHVMHGHAHGVPINIRTRGEPTGYQQMGALVE